MQKKEAIALLGGSIKQAAIAYGCTIQNAHSWKDPLTRATEAQVLLAFSKLPAKQRRENKAKAEAL